MVQVSKLAICLAVYILGLGIIIPVLPFHILSLGGSPAEATAVYSIYSGVSVLTLRFWGQMSDRFGRLPVLWVSTLMTALSYLWLAYAGTIWEIYAARALAGAFSAWLPVAQALVSDEVEADRRAPAMGMLGVGFGIGFTIGPFLGGTLSGGGESTDFATPYLLAFGLAVATAVATALLLREPAHHHTSENHAPHSIWRDRQLLWLLVLYFGLSVVFTGIEGVLAVWGEAEWNWQPKDLGILLMFAGLGNILAQGGLIRLANRHLREARTILLALLLLCASIAGLAFATGFLGITIALVGIAIAMGLHNPAIQSLFSQLAPPEARGKVLGIAQAVSSFARVIGPLWAGLAFQIVGGNSPFWIALSIGILLLTSAVFILKPHLHRDKTAAS